MSESALFSSVASQFDHVIRDPVWGDIPMPESIFELTRAQPFLIADNIRQLGPVSMVYPGATHSRKAHSIGVYSLARRMLLALIERGQISFVSHEGARSFLVAALCHDLGHYPYAHSLKELPLTSHEALAGDIILEEPMRSLVGSCGADPEQVAAIIDLDRDEPHDRETTMFRRFLSGVMDPDKIDYLTRDAFYCGVPYGIQDADFIMRRLFIVDDRLAVDERSEISVEAVLFSKYQMYRAVYWHPLVRSATAMVKKSIVLALLKHEIKMQDLYGLDDEGFRSLVLGKNSDSFLLAQRVFSGRLLHPVAELSYDPANVVHADLDDLEKRLGAESALAMAADLPENEIVIDIPEPINFEVELPVMTAQGLEPFIAHSSIFSESAVRDIRNSLRKIRIYAPKKSRDARIQELARQLLS